MVLYALGDFPASSAASRGQAGGTPREGVGLRALYSLMYGTVRAGGFSSV